jgi:hypothetical protein
VTQMLAPPAGPFVGDVESHLISGGIWFGKAAYHFADPEQRAEVERRVSEIGRLSPGFGLLDRDGSPLLTAAQARAFVHDYDDEAFRTALRMYAAALGFCQIKLSQKIQNGQVAICYERVAGTTWTWIPVRAYTRLQPAADDPTVGQGDTVRLNGVLAFDVAEVAEQLAPKSAAAGRPKPPQDQVNAWLLNYHQDAKDRGGPPPKRDEDAFPKCAKEIGASDRQMREAMKHVPDNLKRQRGARDR